MYFYEAEASDTNSGRNLLGRFIIKGGVGYAIYVETDQHRERSKFVREFYSSFSPYDTAIGTPVLANKTRMFLEDLRSDDSITREAAYNSLDVIQFDDSDAPDIIKAIDANNSGDHSVEIRASLMASLGYLDHPDIIPYLIKKYDEVGDTINFQIPILQAIISQKTKKSTRVFKDLLLSETPLSNESYQISRLFYALDDSLQLAKELYPDFLMLAALPEYNYKVYSYLAQIKTQGYIKKRLYKKELRQIVWEANNESKRQKSSEAGNEKDYYETASRYSLYSYNSKLYNYAVLLLPFEKRNGKVKKFFNRVEQLNSPGLQMDLAVLRAKNGDDKPKEFWLKYAENDNDRIELYEKLEAIDRLDLFPEEYASQDQIAISMYGDKNNLNAFRDSITFVSKELIHLNEDSGYLYFFKVKNKYGDDWRVGYIGLFPSNGEIDSLDVDHYDDEMYYSKYEDMDLQTRLQIRKLQMEDRKRYRVEDEKEFKDLKLNSRLRY